MNVTQLHVLLYCKLLCWFQEAQFATGPFSLSPVRVGAADYTLPFWTGSLKIVGGLRGLQIDPWGFLLPLAPLVWIATLTVLLGLLVLLQLFPSCLHGMTQDRGSWSTHSLSSVRILLQQGEASGTVLSPPI